MKKILLTLALFAVGTFAVQAQLTYTNPVINEDAPDPSVILGDDGYYYLHSTAEHVYRSTDLVNWKYVRQAFGSNPRTLVEPYGVYWAPCITKQGDKYVLYFALSKWGEGDNAMIGVATSNSAGGPFRLAGNDGGKLFTSKEVGVSNSIDPFYFEDNGKKYIVWGSWNKIWAIELTEDGLAVKNMNVKHELAGTRFEAPYIYKRNGYYYMFASIDACCEGARSTYKTVVGRSTSFLGEYKTKNGSSMKNNAFDIVLQTDGGFIAPGHNSRIIEDESGKTWMLFHAYDKNDVDKGRTVCLDEVKWTDDGWPYFENKGASWTEQPAPDLPYIDDDGIRYLKPRVTEHQWGTQFGTIVPADLDNSGRCELIIGAYNHFNTEEPRWNTILETTGAGVWKELETNLNAADRPSFTPCDMNGDGIMDLVIFETLGRNPDDEYFKSRASTQGIYLGVGDGSFEEADFRVVRPTANLPRVFTQPFSDIRQIMTGAVADFNNDGQPDIVGLGINENNVVLINQGNMRFQPYYFDPGTEYEGRGHNFECAVVYTADFNNDGFADILVSANKNNGPNTGHDRERFTEVYLNDGTGTTFNRTYWGDTCPSVSDGGVAIADFNNDGYLDVFCQGPGGFWPGTDFARNITGNDNDGYWDHTYVCLNDGTGHFRVVEESRFDRLDLRNQNSTTGGANAFDWNNDGKKDIVSTGLVFDEKYLEERQMGRIMTITYNTQNISRPATPRNPKAEVDGNKVTLSWEPSTSAQKSTTYELYIQAEDGTLLGNCRAFTSGANNGLRKCEEFGNLGCVKQITYTLPEGNYTWGVQAVDGRRVGSRFATGTFSNITTGIKTIDNGQLIMESHQKVIYNLQGQRISNHHNMKPGVYIINGRKVVVK